MRRAPQSGLGCHATSVQAWPVWDLPRWLLAYIIAVVAADAVAAGFAVRLGTGDLRAALLFGLLLACNTATVEFTRRIGENSGVIKDIHGVWELPAAVLLPPVYALALPVIRIALAQWRVRRFPLHRRVFTAAAIGLSYGAASIGFHVMTGSPIAGEVLPGDTASLWVLAVAVAAMLQWATNTALMLPAFKGSEPTASIRAMVLGRDTVQNDVAELCVAVLVTLGIASSLITILFALPFVTLLQRSVRHTYLLNASRIDLKTGLLNAGTWEREAASEIARAVRTRAPLALALIDIDHFKAINDVHGHLAGDKALKTIARTFKIFVRDYDLVGRFGGEEFVLLLPQTTAADAYRIAERIREHIAALPLDVGDGPDGQPVRVTVSLGVAALGGWERTAGSRVADLLAAADRALYQAKRNGRDQVCMITELAMTPPPPPAAREDSPLTA